MLDGFFKKIKDDKFLSSVFSGDTNIFNEVKKSRGKSSTFSSRIDNKVGSKNIANNFALIYSDLYNKVDLGQEFQNIVLKVKKRVDEASNINVKRIN